MGLLSNRARKALHADSSDDEMDATGDAEALFVAGASDHRGDASSFIRNMRIRQSGLSAKLLAAFSPWQFLLARLH